ncbi:hypothetical protein D3C78_1202960 [compost metagenome]
MPGHGGCEGFKGIVGKPRRFAAQGQALAVAGVQRQVVYGLVDQCGLGQEFIAPGVPGGVAQIIEGLFIQTYFAPAEHGLPVFVEADPVIEKQPVLATVQTSLTVVERPLVRGKILRFAVDVGAADHLVDGVALIHHTAERAGAQGEFVAQAAGIEASAERCLHLIVAPGIVRAAEVVEVVVALRAEVVGHCHAGATGRAVATPGKRTVVIDHYLAARGAEVACPGVAEAVLEIAVEVQRVRGHRF